MPPAPSTTSNSTIEQSRWAAMYCSKSRYVRPIQQPGISGSVDIVVKSPLGTVDLLFVGKRNMGQRLSLFQDRRDELVRDFRRN